MWTDNPVFKTDLENIISAEYIDWQAFAGQTILVTGATGLIGSTVISALLYAEQKMQLGLDVVALVRDKLKAERMYAKQLADCPGKLSFFVGSVEDDALAIKEYHSVDYIIHGASPTASKFFINNPVETIRTAIMGTMNMLELAKVNNVKGFAYLSSMEAYGSPKEDVPLLEDYPSDIVTSSVRSCYPESKRMCENICSSYAAEYDVPAVSLRLSQTFGPGVAADDVRVFAEFARCAVAGKDIVLQTPGDSERTYIYTADAVTAILTALTKGTPGEVYNVSNADTYCSIYEMACQVADAFSNGRSKVTRNVTEESMKKYPPAHHLKLDSSKLLALGWKPMTGLVKMYKNMIETM